MVLYWEEIMRRINLRPWCFFLFTGLFITVLPCYSTNYTVGPQEQYQTIGAVPWVSLLPGDSVLINYRKESYKEKWVICLKGTADGPIVISGIPDSLGRLPVIEGNEAKTDTQFDFWNEERGLIKIGGANKPPDTMPEYIILQNLEIKSARPGYTFTGKSGITNYFKNAAAVYIEKGEHLVIRNCVFHDCGNGFFSASQSTDVLVEACYYDDNGIENSIYEHNNYTESKGIVFQYNRLGPLREHCGGNNLKDRSSGCVIRYNWIEGGNRQLDLVQTDYDHIATDPAYRATFVYGNILIEPDGAGNSQICHYGGDDESALNKYRKGWLYFFHNTLVSTRSGNTTLLRLSTDEESADIRNNIIYGTAAGSRLAIVDSAGRADLRHNWLKTGWVSSHTDPQAAVNDSGNNITGEAPGFINPAKQDFRIIPPSICISGATGPAQACMPDYVPTFEYVKHRMYKERYVDTVPDIGAFEGGPNVLTHYQIVPTPASKSTTWNSPNPFVHTTVMYYTLPVSKEVQVSICNAAGQPVRTIINRDCSSSAVCWDGRDNLGRLLPSGWYTYQIRSGEYSVKGKMILIR